MDLNLKGKVILVTGGAGGIGAAICRACGQELAVPVILDRDADAAHQLQSKLLGEGIISEVIVVELTDYPMFGPLSKRSATNWVGSMAL